MKQEEQPPSTIDYFPHGKKTNRSLIIGGYTVLTLAAASLMGLIYDAYQKRNHITTVPSTHIRIEEKNIDDRKGLEQLIYINNKPFFVDNKHQKPTLRAYDSTQTYTFVKKQHVTQVSLEDCRSYEEQ